jgi:hypothetical protein
MAIEFKNGDEAYAWLMKIAGADTPEFQLRTTIVSAWFGSLSKGDQHWLRYTSEGRKDMWRRFGLVNELCAPPKRETATA